MAGDFEVMITADEAWPAFERAVLAARKHVVAGFRIFDLSTGLRSPEAREIGKDWFDLLAHALRRGVRIDLTVSDFDPVMATDLHKLSWRTVRQGVALSEATGAGKDQLNIRAHRHSARAGMLPRLAFLPAVLRRRWERLRETTPVERRFEAVGLESSVMPNLHTVSHHHKVAVIDDEWLYIGGLDLNERRYDTPDHDRPAQHTWSDVQVMLRGPEAAAARRHLESFQAVTEGRAAPPPCPGLKRTLSAPRRLQMPYLSPRTLVSEIEEAHMAMFRKARHLIHIETQFIRSSRIAEALAEAAARNRDLNAIIVMPGLPEDVAFDSSESLDAKYGLALRQQAVATLRESFGPRLTIATPVRPVLAARETSQTLAGSPLIHVHNKVLIRDADSVLIGSANLNGRSMRWDTELAVEITRPDRVEKARNRLLSHWWLDPLAPEAMSPETLFPLWRDEIRRNGLRRPENRSGFLVPFDASEGADLAQELPGVTEDIV